MTAAIRERIWQVLEDWYLMEVDAGIVMLWEDPQVPGGQAVRVLGSPPVELAELDGIILARRNVGKIDQPSTLES